MPAYHPLIRFSSRDPTPPPPENNTKLIKALLAEREQLKKKIEMINMKLEQLNYKILL